MKRIVSGLMIVVWLATIVGGCQSGHRPTVDQARNDATAFFDTRVGKISAQDPVIAFTKDNAEVPLEVDWANGRGRDTCVFSIGKYEQANHKGLQVAIKSPNGVILWQYRLGVQKGVQTSFILTEKSQDDSLSVIVTKDTVQCTETYLRAGASPLVLSYPAGLIDRAIRGPELSSAELEQVQVLKSAYQNWVNPNSTLNNNRYGNLIDALKNNSEFLAFLGPATMAKAGGDGRCTECEDVCFWAETCALIKCLIPGNPVCWACAGVSFGCWLEDAWNRIVDFFDW